MSRCIFIYAGVLQQRHFDMSRISENTLTAVQPECAVTFGQSRYTRDRRCSPCAAPGLSLPCLCDDPSAPGGHALCFFTEITWDSHDNIPFQRPVLDVLLGLRQKLLGAGQEDYLDDASVIG